MKLIFHGETITAGNTPRQRGLPYRKFGPTADNTNNHWHTASTLSNWTRYGDSLVPTIFLNLVDGGSGDNDGAVNGRIVDPGGLATLKPIAASQEH